MKSANFLKSLVSRARPHDGSDLRRTPREADSGRFAGLSIRGRYYIVMLHNWSPDGVCLDMPVEAKPGDRVKVTSGAINRMGSVRWVEGGRAGVEFG